MGRRARYGGGVIVKLTTQEVITAAGIGMRRQAFADSEKLEHYGGECTRGWFDAHIMGAMAEYAVAKTLNLFWHPNIGKTKEPDVGGFIEVRMRGVPGTGTDLIYKPKDKDELPIVHVLGRVDASFELVGWLYGREAKARTADFWEFNGMWFVPPPYRPIETLIELCRHPFTLEAAE